MFETFFNQSVSNYYKTMRGSDDVIFFSGKENKIKEQKVEQELITNYDKYYRLAYSYVHNPDDAADIVQNGAYKAIKASMTLKNEEYVATWVYRIMLNEVFSFLNKPIPVSYEEIYDGNAEDILGGKEDVYEDIDLKKALNNLDAKDKAVVELRYFEDMKLEDIAYSLNENISTVKSRLYRSMKKLRLELEGVE